MKPKQYPIEDSTIKEVNEAIQSYVKSIDQSIPFKIYKTSVSYSDFFENKMLIVHAIREGLPFGLYSKIKELTPFTEDDWAEYLNLSKKTLQRHSNEEEFHFKPIHTEKIIELAEVTNYGNEVFDSTEQFYLWLNTPSLALGNFKPAELLKDSYGKDMVMAELNKIEHGIFA
ncbi:MAG TPA: antitoxin Xre/MbcA/ParS toxin-binding domain-containing protein [Aquaticitalea sp.]|nr:antitoxin Xre/MbcA/ParS toxin-binding domain-containing protein [Aquaticitalea sp.]